MELVDLLVCPRCGASRKSSQAMRVGDKVPCVRCGAFFSVSDCNAPVSASGAGMNHRRLRWVLVSLLVYLSVGVALGAWCVVRSARPSALTPNDQQNPLEGETDAEVPAPVRPVSRATSSLPTAEQRKIDDAIVRGVWYLKGQQTGSGPFGDLRGIGGNALVGFAALPGLTLLECGVAADDPIIQQAAAFVRKAAPAGLPSFQTYQRALAILFLDRLGDPRDKELIQYLALALMAGQRTDDGGWSYDCPLLDRNKRQALLQGIGQKQSTLADWQKEALTGIAFAPGPSDNSNTQFAILALWAAKRHGVHIGPSVLLIAKRFTTTQYKAGKDPNNKLLDLDGAWPYNPAAGTTSSEWPTMTCSGLLGMAVVHGLGDKDSARKDRPLDDDHIKRGLALLGREIDRKDETRARNLYFLWSLERVGVLYDLPKIAGKDWHAWGRAGLLSSQQPDGSWKDGGYWSSHPILDTCFALLFLEKVNLAKDLSEQLQKLQLLQEKK